MRAVGSLSAYVAAEKCICFNCSKTEVASKRKFYSMKTVIDLFLVIYLISLSLTGDIKSDAFSLFLLDQLILLFIGETKEIVEVPSL